MRLLNVTTQEVEEFHEADIPPYAILSHTWGTEELTRQEVESIAQHRTSQQKQQSATQLKAGYAKMAFACSQAAKDGYRYVWIDSCCIDKKSSAEISEAVNSMFNWYQRAAVCYAYLDDVHFDDYTQGYRTWKDDFISSRWFTRGWTLPELLAPRKVVFFAKGWRLLGTKSSLVKTIEKITGIDELTLLEPRLIHNASVAQRMSWAANRTTTRPEDAAYSLMGLFNVNMPIIYGEGENAFLRLQEEIIKRSDDHSIFAWGTLGRGDNPHPTHPHPDHHLDASDLDYDTLTGSVGILARSPKDFAGMQHVVVCTAPPEKHPTSDYALTNKGLHIKLPLVRVHFGHATTSQRHYLGVLDCCTETAPDTRLGVLLAESISGVPNNNVYLRTRTRMPTVVSAADLATLAKPRLIYIPNRLGTGTSPAAGGGIGGNVMTATAGEEEIILIRAPDLFAPGYDVLDIQAKPGAHWNRELRTMRLAGLARRKGRPLSGLLLYQLAVVPFFNRHMKCGFVVRVLVDAGSRNCFVDLLQQRQRQAEGGQGQDRPGEDGFGSALVEEAKRVWENPGSVEVSMPGLEGDPSARGTVTVDVVNPVVYESKQEAAAGTPGVEEDKGLAVGPGDEIKLSSSVTFIEKWERDYQREVEGKVARKYKGVIELSLSSRLWLAPTMNNGEELDQLS
ncbi:HET-domain-containing protein [Canariomyces notabilis]|uniref:HET-domain-containing protein n=1 Tax=Canariomyces notabilis TaxID=2074819 RepID=A0AAN6YWG7_9PEZI|nr:HET-domain-containing protein [Canariomyces arenarius]